MESKEKVIVVDWSIFLNMATHTAFKMPGRMQPTYLAMTMILGNLKRIGVEPCDEVIIACDHLSSWRKQYIPQAKADRQEIRDKSGINWTEIYEQFNTLLEQVKQSTNWNVVQVPHIEADDIMSTCCRYYNDKEVILLTMDGDLELCFHYSNVKIFSPHRQMKRYKIRPKNFNVYKAIARMVTTKGHNNLDIPIENEDDYAIKEMCVNLIKLPEWVENKIKDELVKLKTKTDDIGNFPFNSLKERYGSLYNSKKDIITYAQCVAKEERKQKKKKKKLKQKKQKVTK